MNALSISRWTLALIILLVASAAQADEVRWLSRPADLVINTYNFEQTKSSDAYWEGMVSNPGDPIIELKKTSLNAAREKYLYVKMSADSGTSIQVFFSGGKPFNQDMSFREDIGYSPTPTIYRFDLSELESWKGTITGLRLDPDGCEKGSLVRLYGVGVSATALKTVDGQLVIPHNARSQQAIYNDRMAAWHETMVTTEELRPNSCISTYHNDSFAAMDTFVLAKLVTGVKTAEGEVWPESAQNTKVEDFPGGVKATYTLHGVEVTTELVPLMIGRDTPEQEGAALLTVKTDPPTPVVIKCGEGALVGYQKKNRVAWLRNDAVGIAGDAAKIEGDTILLTSSKQPFMSAVTSSGKIEIGGSKDTGEFAVVRFPEGKGIMLLAYSKDAAKAAALAAMNPQAARKQVSDYYQNLLICKIETPEKNLDAAFRAALYNLEYNWVKPYGWTEAIHHWLALWHMQHTGAAEWIGQTDRSRDCIVTSAQHLLPDGSIPQFMPSGTTRKDFGGSNQFYAWECRHYWRFTGDKEMAKLVAPALDQSIEQTFRESDPDNDGLLAWGQQIGNQEDYISTPFNGTSPSIEGANMLKTAAELWRALGQEEKAKAYEVRASEIVARLRTELWQGDLGRFAFYKDPTGQIRLDGQYHTMIYPLIWGILDPLDSWTSMRHLRDRLIGKNGETYCSNNFPCHAICTAGPQAGVAQQPWAAWGLSAMGLRNETYRPLKAAADWAMNADHKGSWPEISLETTAAYFSPPAGLYVQSITEALFGLQVNKPAGYLQITPSFPDAWPSAKLTLPDYSATYSRKGNILQYDVRSASPLARRLRWALPPCSNVNVTVNGKAAKPTLSPGVNCMVLSVDTPSETKTTFKISYKPLTFNLKCPASVAEGEAFGISVLGAKIESVEDRSAVLSSFSEESDSKVQVRVRRGQLEPYSGFGRLGQLNFSRRTFFLSCSAAGGARFWVPVDITILPEYECAAKGEVSEDGKIALLVRNNTYRPLSGTAYLRLVRQTLPFSLNVAPRAEKAYSVTIPQNFLSLLSPGENEAALVLPGPRELRLIVTVSRLFDNNSKLAEYARSRIVNIPLPEDKLVTDATWRTVRSWSAYGHYPWAASKPPLEALADAKEVTVPGLPHVTFKINNRKFVPVSYRSGSPSVVVNTGSKKIKKLYLLIIPFLDNHDTFISAGRVDVRTTGGILMSKTLHFPGDLDWWNPEHIVGPWATSTGARPVRHGLLPLLKETSADWKEGAPPAFPQPEFWAKCLAYKTASSAMNVVEVDLGRPTIVDSVAISTFGSDPALGVVAISAEVENGQQVLQDTPYMPPAEFRESVTLFSFSEIGDLEGWKTEGEAFYVAAVPSLFDVPTLNSLAKAGEMATGKAISPEFKIGSQDTSLVFELQGGNSLADDGPGTLHIALVDSVTGNVLERLPSSGSHVLRQGRMDVSKHRGKNVRLELVDMNTSTSYAWLGVRKVEISPN